MFTEWRKLHDCGLMREHCFLKKKCISPTSPLADRSLAVTVITVCVVVVAVVVVVVVVIVIPLSFLSAYFSSPRMFGTLSYRITPWRIDNGTRVGVVISLYITTGFRTT